VYDCDPAPHLVNEKLHNAEHGHVLLERREEGASGRRGLDGARTNEIEEIRTRIGMAPLDSPSRMAIISSRMEIIKRRKNKTLPLAQPLARRVPWASRQQPPRSWPLTISGDIAYNVRARAKRACGNKNSLFAWRFPGSEHLAD